MLSYHSWPAVTYRASERLNDLATELEDSTIGSKISLDDGDVTATRSERSRQGIHNVL